MSTASAFSTVASGGSAMNWLKIAFQFLAALLGIKKAGQDAQTVVDQKATIDALERERDSENRAPGTIDQMADDARRGKL